MTQKSSFISDLSREEHEMLMSAESLFGAYWRNALAYNGLLNNFVKEIRNTDALFFVNFFAQVRKHHTLALLSIVRRHYVQTQMNNRQTIEAAVNAAYGMAHYEKEDFVRDGADGVMEDVSPSKKYKWLEENYKSHSAFLRKQKQVINDGPAHSSAVYAFIGFEFNRETGFNAPFFDVEDKFRTENDLWLSGNLAMGIMDLFAIANRKYTLFTLQPNFVEIQKELEEENHRLKAEIGSNVRIKKWLPKVS